MVYDDGFGYAKVMHCHDSCPIGNKNNKQSCTCRAGKTVKYLTPTVEASHCEHAAIEGNRGCNL